MQWRMSARLSAMGQLHLDRPEDATAASGQQSPDWGPVDYLVGAVASCFAKSCQMVLQALGEPMRAVEVAVTAHKADAKPSRVGKVSIQYVIDDLTAERAARIAKDAKRICTVTNSLNCEFELVS